MKRGDHDIDEMLKRLSETAQPPAPASIGQNVLRRIRQLEPERGGWRPGFWPRWITNPAFGLGMILISAAIGILFSSAIGAGEANQHGGGVGFDPSAVFSDRAPGMLSPRFVRDR